METQKLRNWMSDKKHFRQRERIVMWVPGTLKDTKAGRTRYRLTEIEIRS